VKCSNYKLYKIIKEIFLLNMIYINLNCSASTHLVSSKAFNSFHYDFDLFLEFISVQSI